MPLVKQKPRIALFTTVIDNRAARGTALVGRHYLEQIARYEDRFDFTLIHNEPCDDPIYKRYPEIVLLRLPGILDKRALNEAAYWIRRGSILNSGMFDICHYLHPSVWPSYLLTPAKKIVVTAFEGNVMLGNTGTASAGQKTFRFTNRYLHQRMDAIIACSESGKKEIVQWYKVPEKKVHSILLGVDGTYAPQEKNAMKTDTFCKKYEISAPYLLAVSRFDPHKNILRLLQAYAQFLKNHPAYMLVLVGGPHMSGYSDKVEALIRKINEHEQHVIVLPFVDDSDMPSLYSYAEALVYPSLHEGFGLPVVEAMASGTAVITSNTTSLPEVGGDAVLYVDPEDTDSIAEAMAKVVSDPAVRERLVQRGLVQAHKFSWEQMAQETIGLYEKILSGHS